MSSRLFFLHNDAAILEMMQKGNEDALVILHRKNKETIHSFVRRNNGSRDDAEDLLQEALIVLWERVKSGKFRLEAKLSTFIFAVVKNLWSRRIALRRRETPVDFQEDFLPGDEKTVLDDLIEDESTMLVRRAMEELGEQCRKILLLFYWEECSMAEIAAAMGFANAETAKAKKYQCKRELERILKRTESRIS